MRILLAFILLSSLWVEGKNQHQTRQPETKSGQDANHTPNKPSSVEQASTPNRDSESSAEQQTASQEPRPWLTHGEWVMAVLTLIYVVITGFYAVTSHRTLNAITEQGNKSADQFQQQLAEMKTAREQTIEQMRNAVRQTGDLVRQGAAQVAALNISANIATKSADAAKKSADALVNTERSWVFAYVGWANEEHPVFIAQRTQQGEELPVQTGIHIVLTCKNQGRTPAWITRKFLRFEIAPKLPNEPSFRFEDCIDYALNPIAPDHSVVICPELFADGRPTTKESAGYIYGRILYRDVFGDHETTFGYYFYQPRIELARMPAPAEYNEIT